MINSEQMVELDSLSNPEKEQKFFQACVQNDRELVHYCLYAAIITNGKQYKKALKIVTQEGHFDLAKELINKFEKYTDGTKYYALSIVMKAAAKSGQVEILKFVLESITDPDNLNSDVKISYEFACEFNQPKVIDFLMNNNYSKDAMNLCQGYMEAVSYSSLDVIKYFTTLPEWSKTIRLPSFNFLNDMYGSEKALDIVKIFLDMKEDGYPPYIHHADDYYLNFLATKMKYHPKDYEDHEKIVTYLVCEYKIEKTPGIIKLIAESPAIAKIFALRDLNESLNQDLKENNNGIKVKI